MTFHSVLVDQWLDRLVYTEKVIGSNPVRDTRTILLANSPFADGYLRMARRAPASLVAFSSTQTTDNPESNNDDRLSFSVCFQLYRFLKETNTHT